MHKSNFILQSLLSIVILTTSINISSQKKVNTKIEVKKTTEVINPISQSITYTLPQTVLSIELETEKIIKKAGPYYRYSQRFLNLKDVITEDSEEWTIRGVRITTEGEPNNNQRYSIFSDRNSSANRINLNEKGILLGINNYSNTYITQESNKTYRTLSIDDINFNEISLPEALLFKTSTAAMAQEAANMIYKIRSNRIQLLSGELENLPPDGEAYKTVLNELNEMEKKFISLFTGKTISVKKVEKFKILANPLKNYTNHVICRFSAQKGIVDAMNIAGTPIYLKINRPTESKLENKQAIAPKEPKANGLFYYLPGSATVSVIDKNNELISEKIQLAQYGQVISMPASILEQDNIVIDISPITGALISISKR